MAAERARNRQTALLSRSLIDRELIVSEARACEQELSEVEVKMFQLKGEIKNKEARIAQLEGKSCLLHQLCPRSKEMNWHN